MEFVSKDAEMILVKTSPAELKQFAAIIRAVHGWDFVICEMDLDNALELAERMEKAEENSWVFHEREAFHLGSVLGTALHAMPLDRVNHFSPIEFSRDEIKNLMADINSVAALAREA